MPTDPHPAVLDRHLSVASAREVIEIACPLLRELVDHGTLALVRCGGSAEGDVDVDVAPLALYRLQLEAVDGIEVLLSAACVNATVPLLRSTFEALLALEYICETKEDYVRRSLSWLLCYNHQRLDLYDRLNPATTKGQEFQKILDADRVMRGKLKVPHDVEAARARLASVLEKPHFQPIETEFRSFERRPVWFRLFNGPRNLRELAVHLNRGGLYETLYRVWSRVAHAQDFLSFVDGEGALKRLRNPAELRSGAGLAASFLLASTRILVGKFREGEDLEPWCVREVRDRYLWVSGNA
jgi:hypothetical protein